MTTADLAKYKIAGAFALILAVMMEAKRVTRGEQRKAQAICTFVICIWTVHRRKWLKGEQKHVHYSRDNRLFPGYEV